MMMTGWHGAGRFLFAEANMDRVFLTPDSQEHWLALREEDLTSTECAALFGVSPYMTLYELYLRKTGQLAFEFEENERMKWGTRLESAIAYGVAEDYGLIVEPFKSYGRINPLRMGSSFDYKVVGLAPKYVGDETYRDLFRTHGPGIMEVKNVDGLAFRRGWINDEDGMEAPPHIEIQVQHQLQVAGLKWSMIAPLVGGNTPRPFHRLFDEEMADIILRKVAEFWRMVDERKAPPVDYVKDAQTVARLLGQDDGQEVDMTDNERLAELVATYNKACEEEKELKKRKDAAKTEALLMIGKAAKVKVLGNLTLSAKSVRGSEGTLITPELVGTRIGGRSGYRGFRLSGAK